jgi:flagellar hook-basal body complex protein FliE
MNIISQTLSAIDTGPNATKQTEFARLTSAAASAGLRAVDDVKGPGFGEVMAGMAGGVVGRLNQAEYVSMKAVQGEANTREVVDALMTAEQSLNTAIAIRDKIVTAYLEVARMQI